MIIEHREGKDWAVRLIAANDYVRNSFNEIALMGQSQAENLAQVKGYEAVQVNVTVSLTKV